MMVDDIRRIHYTQKGRQEGRQEAKVELVKSLLAVDVDIEKIIKASGFTKEQIAKIKNEIPTLDK